MVEWEEIFKEAVLFSVGALAGAYIEPMINLSKLYKAILGFLIVMVGVYIDHDGWEDIVVGFGLPFIAAYLMR